MADEYLQQLVENTDPKGTDFLPIANNTTGKLQKVKHSRVSFEHQFSTPDANVTGEVGVIDVITMTSMTADRDYILPATAAVGERAGVMVVDGDDTYVINIKTGGAGDKINNVDHSSTAFTSLDSAGDIRVFRCIDAAGPHWVSEIAGEDATAIHTDVAGEINGITEKTTPVAQDWGILEDSEDSNNKKKYLLGNSPGASGELTYKELASFDFSSSSSTSEDVNVTGYDVVELRWEDIGFNIADGIWVRVSTDGVTFDSGASDYRNNQVDHSANSSAAGDSMQINAGATGTANRHGWAQLLNLSSSVFQTRYRSISGTHSANENIIRHGYRDAAQVDKYIQIRSALGNTINAGRLAVYGVGKSTSDGVGEEVKRCRARPASDLTAVNASSGYIVPLDSEDFDVGGWHDNVTNNTRITVPSDAKDQVDVVAYLRVSNLTANEWGFIQIYKNGAAYRQDGGETGLTIWEGGLTLKNESVVPGTTYYELRFQNESDTSVTVETESSLMVKESIQTHGNNGALILKASTPNANVQGVVGQLDVLTMSSMTADRDYLLPAGASVGDRCGVQVVDGDPDYEILIKTGGSGDKINGTDHSTNEWSRLFIAGERVEFVCIDAAGPHWLIDKDGRIPMSARMSLGTAIATNTAATWTNLTFDTVDDDLGDCGDATNNGIKSRRKARWRGAAGMLQNSAATDQNNGKLRVTDGTTVFAESNGEASGTTSIVAPPCPFDGAEVAAGTLLTVDFQTQEANKGVFNDGRTYFVASEIL